MGSTHVQAWLQIPGAELAAVASRDPRRLSGDLTGVQGNLGGQGGKLDFSAVAQYTSAEEAVLDPAVEAVDICLPTHLHERIAVLALGAGKHVLVEKPMALDGAAADRMIAAAERHGRVLMAAQVVRFIPPYRAAADILRSGRLGAVRAAIFRRRCAAPALERLAHGPRAKRRRRVRSADPRHRFLPARVRQAGRRNSLRIRRSGAWRGLDSRPILVSVDRRGGHIGRLASSGSLSVFHGVHHRGR